MSIFIKKGHFCLVQKNSNEIQEHFVHRGFAIVSKCPTTREEFDKNVLLSNYLSNIKFMGCSYADSVNVLCKEMEKNLATN
jgi:hypothetical protein